MFRKDIPKENNWVDYAKNKYDVRFYEILISFIIL